jgi:hypothetical protein
MPHCRGRDATRSTGDATNSPGPVPITVSWCGVMRYSRPACLTVSCYTTVLVSSSMPVVVADCRCDALQPACLFNCFILSCYTTVVSSIMPVVADCLFVPDGSGRCMCPAYSCSSF